MITTGQIGVRLTGGDHVVAESRRAVSIVIFFLRMAGTHRDHSRLGAKPGAKGDAGRYYAVTSM